MAWDEREYYRSPSEGRAGGVAQFGNVGFIYPRWGSITLYLIIANCAVFFLDAAFARMFGMPGGALAYEGMRGYLDYWGFFSAETAFLQAQVWRLITFQFLHGHGWHLFGNMILLFFLGTFSENHLGPRRFLAFYLLSGVGGVLGYMFFWGTGLLDTTAVAPMRGASAGVFGVLVAATIVAPNMRILLFFVLPVPLKALLYVLLFVAAYMVIARGDQPGFNAGGEAAHLGGAAIGFLLIKKSHWLDWADRFRGNPVQSVKHSVQQKQQQRVKAKKQNEEAEVDRILDKVRDQGLQSLSRTEKKILNRATERQRGGR